MTLPAVDLGFVEPVCDSRLLESRFFPSKVGGRPSWLDLRSLPSTQRLRCPRCDRPMSLLCQVYAPFEDDPDAFHRTVFVFLCNKSNCHSGEDSRLPFAVLRCQLPRENEFYPSTAPPDDDPEWRPDVRAEAFVKVCDACGCLGEKTCGACKLAHYCSREHQTLDWKAGHREECKSGQRQRPSTRWMKEVLLPEFELVIEAEEKAEEKAEESEGEESEEEKEERRMQEFLQLEASGGTGHLSAAELEGLDIPQQPGDNKALLTFKKAIKSDPDQVLRYNKGGSPLWISSDGIPDVIPPCQYCGGPRRFEFQIMPQLLASLQLDSKEEESVDWGILAVYTCRLSCKEGPAYKEEFVHRQFT